MSNVCRWFVMLNQGLVSDVGNILVKNTSNDNNVYIKSILLHELQNTSNTSVILYVVPNDNGSVGTGANKEIESITMAPFETYEYSLNFPIILPQTNDSLQGLASNSNTISFLVLGVKD